MLIAVALHPVHTLQILSDRHFQGSGSCAMQDAHPLGTELDGIINELGDGLQCLIGPHTAHINIGFEVQLPVADLIGGHAA